MVQLTSITVGAAGEQLAAAEFIKHGAEVYWPAGSYSADMLVQTASGIYRVQVKTTEAEETKVVFRFRGSHNMIYEGGKVDYFAAVHLTSGRVLLLPAAGRKNATVDFRNVNPEWDFDAVFARMKEGGAS